MISVTSGLSFEIRSVGPFFPCRGEKSALRGPSGPSGPGSPGSVGLPVRVQFHPARPRPAVQTAGAAAQAAAAAGAGGLQHSSASQHGGCPGPGNNVAPKRLAKRSSPPASLLVSGPAEEASR